MKLKDFDSVFEDAKEKNLSISTELLVDIIITTQNEFNKQLSVDEAKQILRLLGTLK